MTQLFKNNAQGALVAELNERGTLAMLATGHGARFPAPMNGDYFLATLVRLDANGQEDAWEIVKCTGRATDGLTIVRAQEGTAARTWPIGTRFEMRVTAGTLDSFTSTEEAGAAAPVQSVAGKRGAVTLGKADVGLEKVDNTADADKPVSKAVQQALNGKEAVGTAAAAVQTHGQAPDPHPQYQAKLVSGTNIKTVNGKSLLGQGNVVIAGGGVTLEGDTVGFVTEERVYNITNYNSFLQYTARVSAGQVSVLGDQVVVTLPNTPGNVALTVSAEGAESTFTIPVRAAGVRTPTATAPSNNAVIDTPSVTLAASEFEFAGVADTHLNSDWQIAKDKGFVTIVQSLNANAANKTTWAVSGLQPGQTYFWRVRYRGAKNGVSEWSAPLALRTAAEFLGLIGQPDTKGFGVGTYPGPLPAGFSEMPGTKDKNSDNYGNYTYSDGSVMVFVPKFYYRFGHASSPRFATYKKHAIDIAGADMFADEAAANAAGYVLHRAFKDGGQVKPGFFMDKYPAGFNENKTNVVSKKGLNPISSIDTNSATVVSGLQGAPEARPSATTSAVLFVWAARQRKPGTFHLPSVFMYGAVAFLSLAQRQTCTSTTNCAWYHATHNFPKGADSSSAAPSDPTDAALVFQKGETCYWVNHWGAKVLTGGASVYAKTTHNGQNNGIGEITGGFGEIALGVTTPTDSFTMDYYLNGADREIGYMLKESVKLASLTPGHKGATDVWQSAATIANLYDKVPDGYLASATSRSGPGDVNTAVFSNTTTGGAYAATSCGICNKGTALNTNLYRNATQIVPYYAGQVPFISQNGTGYFGLFTRAANPAGSNNFKVSGFRCAAFGD